MRGYPDAAAHVTPARIRLAAATRALVEAVASSDDASEAELDAAAAGIEAVTRALRAAPPGTPVVRERERRWHDYLPRSPLVGAVSPLAPPATYEFADGLLDLRVRFGAAFEGPPGHVHGGFVALAFDELLGMVTVLSGYRGFTGRLSVRYRQPTPLYEELRATAWVEHHEGRRTAARGALRAGDVLTAEAEGLFVTMRPDAARARFGR